MDHPPHGTPLLIPSPALTFYRPLTTPRTSLLAPGASTSAATAAKAPASASVLCAL